MLLVVANTKGFYSFISSAAGPSALKIAFSREFLSHLKVCGMAVLYRESFKFTRVLEALS